VKQSCGEKRKLEYRKAVTYYEARNGERKKAKLKERWEKKMKTHGNPERLPISARKGGKKGERA